MRVNNVMLATFVTLQQTVSYFSFFSFFYTLYLELLYAGWRSIFSNMLLVEMMTRLNVMFDCVTAAVYRNVRHESVLSRIMYTLAQGGVS